MKCHIYFQYYNQRSPFLVSSTLSANLSCKTHMPVAPNPYQVQANCRNQPQKPPLRSHLYSPLMSTCLDTKSPKGTKHKTPLHHLSNTSSAPHIRHTFRASTVPHLQSKPQPPLTKKRRTCA